MPAQWLVQHGYRPLMAESFSDPESHAATLMCAPHLPENCQAALVELANASMPQKPRSQTPLF
jgi:hypothetical protein